MLVISMSTCDFFRIICTLDYIDMYGFGFINDQRRKITWDIFRVSGSLSVNIFVSNCDDCVLRDGELGVSRGAKHKF